jgi:hypothetical protein
MQNTEGVFLDVLVSNLLNLSKSCKLLERYF